MTNTTLNLTPALYQYMLEHSVHEAKPLKLLREKTAAIPMSQMQISPEQGQFMAFLVKALGVTKALEVGTYTGYSAMAVAFALPDDGKLIACDIREDWAAIAKEHWQTAGVAHKIDLRIAPASDTLAQLIAQGEVNSFDFAFIDADKTGYPDYYEKALQLLKPNGIMLIDNVLQAGQVIDSSVTKKSVVAIQQFNKQLYQDKRVDISMIPMSDGLTLVRKR